MFYKKSGLPEEGDIVICTVKKVLYHSVFVDLDEYDKKEGVIHISEISPGRIRNIRDFVREEKKIVCKVLKVDQEKGHIDLSLRRVTTSMRKKKNEEYKQEQKAEIILEIVSKKTKKSMKEIYDLIGNKIIERYGLLSPFFYAVVKDESLIDKINIPKGYIKPLTEIIKERVKLPEIKIRRKLKIQSYEPDGIELIKNILKKVEEFGKKNKNKIEISYVSAPIYNIDLTSQDFKTAEDDIEKVTDYALEIIHKEKCIGEVINA